jgi:SPP1 gp7 family putative phage head morphogenesis protein
LNKREKEVIQMQLEQEKRTLHQLERQYNAALSTVNAQIAMLQAKWPTASRLNRIAFQKQLREQLEAVIAKLHGETYQTIEQFMNDSYSTGYVGAMYDLHKQGVPIIVPIDNNAAIKAVMTDTKLKHGVYRELGVDMATLKKKISNELTRGVATGMAYDDIARNIKMATGAPLGRAKTIVRTEGHRIQQASQEDARQVAKSKGADVVKQWDATLDSATRDTHRRLDGQIREVDEPFEINGLSAMYPGEFGDPAEDCNCRCVALTRARKALDSDELKTMQERAAFFKLDKSKSFADFQKKYMKATEET